MAVEEKAPVSVLGLGPMGRAIAEAFLAEGHPVTVWNRSPGKADALVAKGASAAATPAEAAAASPLVVACVIDYAAVRAIVEPAFSALRGAALVNLTADLPERAREMAEWASRNGIGYLDGAVMTPAATIGGPEAVLLYSGDTGVYRTHRRALSALGGSATHLGADPGRAAAYDVALLDVFWTAMTGLAHAFALAGAQNVTAGELAPFAQGLLDLASSLALEIARDADAGTYPGDGSTLASNAASMAHILHAARACGVDTGLMAAAAEAADRAVEAGYGEDGFARMVEFLGRS